MKTITALAPWFGSNRMLAPHVGTALGRLDWCGVPFAGGMCELPHIEARTIMVSDLHRHVINLARVVAIDWMRHKLIHSLRRQVFHPDTLQEAADLCSNNEPGVPPSIPDMKLAEAYFICCWMGRNHKAGTTDRKTGGGEMANGLSLRWNSNGGDSVVRYQSAIRMLGEFSRTLRRCTFNVMDAFEMLERCEDAEGHGIYADPPFFKTGRPYRHNCGNTAEEELAWHTRLRDSLFRFRKTRVVLRAYEHPKVRKLYMGWHFNEYKGRTQANEDAAELLVVNWPVEKGGLWS